MHSLVLLYCHTLQYILFVNLSILVPLPCAENRNGAATYQRSRWVFQVFRGEVRQTTIAAKEQLQLNVLFHQHFNAKIWNLTLKPVPPLSSSTFLQANNQYQRIVSALRSLVVPYLSTSPQSQDKVLFSQLTSGWVVLDSPQPHMHTGSKRSFLTCAMGACSLLSHMPPCKCSVSCDKVCPQLFLLFQWLWHSHLLPSSFQFSLWVRMIAPETAQTSAPIRGKSSGTTKGASVNNG